MKKVQTQDVHSFSRTFLIKGKNKIIERISFFFQNAELIDLDGKYFWIFRKRASVPRGGGGPHPRLGDRAGRQTYRERGNCKKGIKN